MPSSPTVWRRWLALELRRFRAEAGLTAEDVGKALGKSRQRVRSIELATQGVSEDQLVDVLLPLYGVREERWYAYVQAAKAAGKPGWWQRYRPPDWLNLYVGYEWGATALDSYQSTFIDGLLQTEEYARALMRRVLPPLDEDEVLNRVGMRMERQAGLTREPNPLDLNVILDEAVLRRVVGSREVMREQLEALTDRPPNVTVRVLPADRGAHLGIVSFKVLRFDLPNDPGVVYVEYLGGSIILETVREVGEHDRLYEQLGGLALKPDDSARMIRELARDYAQ